MSVSVQINRSCRDGGIKNVLSVWDCLFLLFCLWGGSKEKSERKVQVVLYDDDDDDVCMYLDAAFASVTGQL